MITLCVDKKTDSFNKGNQSETGVIMRTVVLFNILFVRVRGIPCYNKYSTGELNKQSKFDSFKAHGLQNIRFHNIDI